ncbi:MAG: hypothetical protein UR26_C0001G0108 [candidate division TM6 bacterium GW2011_GWF2_32_72]|nr:MAG: hypothetical protein UR26_C0001G0108 [candidate division TM6 bacterium GW2011_GWF2_32_72]
MKKWLFLTAVLTLGILNPTTIFGWGGVSATQKGNQTIITFHFNGIKKTIEQNGMHLGGKMFIGESFSANTLKCKLNWDNQEWETNLRATIIFNGQEKSIEITLKNLDEKKAQIIIENNAVKLIINGELVKTKNDSSPCSISNTTALVTAGVVITAITAAVIGLWPQKTNESSSNDDFESNANETINTIQENEQTEQQPAIIQDSVQRNEADNSTPEQTSINTAASSNEPSVEQSLTDKKIKLEGEKEDLPAPSKANSQDKDEYIYISLPIENLITKLENHRVFIDAGNDLYTTGGGLSLNGFKAKPNWLSQKFEISITLNNETTTYTADLSNMVYEKMINYIFLEDELILKIKKM